MAYKIYPDLTGSLAPTADYPRGDTKDNPGGTLVNRAMVTDLLQFQSKLIADAGMTPNSLPDNVTNGFQVMDAFKWHTGNFRSAGSPSATFINNVGTPITATINVKFNKYVAMGTNMVVWQMCLSPVTVAANAKFLIIALPADLIAATKTFTQDIIDQGICSDGLLQVQYCFDPIGGVPSPQTVLCYLPSGSNFTAGSNKFYSFTITTELI